MNINLNQSDELVRLQLGKFIRELNKREYSVRLSDEFNSFEDYVRRGYVHQQEFGTGFAVNGLPVPYFHPNRSFHDEIIWLNDHLYYNPEVTFEDKLINSAIVKFYGPANTLDLITGNSDFHYLTKTNYKYVNYRLLTENPEYEQILCNNIEQAFANKQKIWGTTELRTSLQTNSRNYARGTNSNRKMLPSDMIKWVRHLAPGWVDFYKTKPNMEQSFKYLTQTKGIGNYYGYHFSSNLARMPGIGVSKLLRDTSIEPGNLDENADYVVAGPGATETLSRLFPGIPLNTKSAMEMILAIRDNQSDFFGITGDLDAEMHLSNASELGKFTTFGIEISCCQFNVFNRTKDNIKMAMSRANAPISKLTKASVEQCNILEF